MIKVKDGEITLDYLGGPHLTTWVFKIREPFQLWSERAVTVEEVQRKGSMRRIPHLLSALRYRRLHARWEIGLEELRAVPPKSQQEDRASVLQLHQSASCQPMNERGSRVSPGSPDRNAALLSTL